MVDRTEVDLLIIGAGPAGLMAAETASAAGVSVLLAEAKPSVGRKFLMAGKSGLNLTKDEPLEMFLGRYDRPWLRKIVAGFGPRAVMDWAEGLGQPVFTGSSGRVFPKAMKASPLLRAWMGRLTAMGVKIATNHRWTGWEPGGGGDLWTFDHRGKLHSVQSRAGILCLGGASWSRLGSDGAWAPILATSGLPLSPFRPANMGFNVEWSEHMRPFFGRPLKSVILSAGDQRLRAEAVISARGIEGGGIYALSSRLRDGAGLVLDLMPDHELAEIEAALRAMPAQLSLGNRLRRLRGLDATAAALLLEWGRPLAGPAEIAARIKHLDARLSGPRPLDEAISTAGGLASAGFDDNLRLTLPGYVFAAGEMLDWEAPTGGYLLTACLATGRHAGRAAAMALGACSDS